MFKSFLISLSGALESYIFGLVLRSLFSCISSFIKYGNYFKIEHNISRGKGSVIFYFYCVITAKLFLRKNCSLAYSRPPLRDGWRENFPRALLAPLLSFSAAPSLPLSPHTLPVTAMPRGRAGLAGTLEICRVCK